MINSLLISGTDTDAGKTVLTTALIAYWKKYCSSHRLGVMKPLQSGVGDRELYSQLFSLEQSLEEITPLYFQAPLAPPIAAEQEGRKVELEKVWAAFCNLQQQRDFVIIEGVGGLGSPITYELIVADLARDWRLPTVLVVPVRLGAIAQAVSNVALARRMGVNIRGIILNCGQPCQEQDIENWSPIHLIESLTQIPVLGILPYLENPRDINQLAQVASHLKLEQILPILTLKPSVALS
ncbi:dethiobiotin synthase [Limnoraphis robusta Tam1]|uniref:dethiobiotin synthase n=1 Tax=Limnoraphis robusta TaxID=1118279 RepID=UPI002B1F5135|nr:dethiobiotin synthase [Limnoraphis robusta]MEA5500311.1 dethiobiotin synthase [Limnoraphis robusta BA-68 BA1]MEA5538631.1 dethiobiotin synthase [Limnoraphis robusta Tam1]